MMRIILFVLFLGIVFVGMAHADEADVIAVEVRGHGDRLYVFDVTVSHKDTGWNHYANRWEILNSDGTLYGTRTLHHPHVDEQPFTRSMSGVKIPAGVKVVRVRAHDSIHEYGGVEMTVAVP